MDGTTPCRGRRAVDPAQSTPKGRFVLRADSIRPYGSSGEAALAPLKGELAARTG